ncbi:uncharacterized protein LOC129290149 isoform X2 [Prosopis cineraria]|uniref:uncharacterized protein LOC129290149 isoform X2 n=1 Tax=Prosopis cineraria TaxID=364024 RepID=UPI00241081B7|nr:uncharacterized protein LOC129290149 isoform X2 [Prosopis cineraria]
MEEDFESAEEDFESDTEEDFKQRRRDGFSGDQVWPSRPPPPPPFQSQSETICIWWEYLFPAPDSFLTPSYPRSPPPLLQPSQSPSPLPRSPVLQSSSSSLSSPSSPSPPQLAWKNEVESEVVVEDSESDHEEEALDRISALPFDEALKRRLREKFSPDIEWPPPQHRREEGPSFSEFLFHHRGLTLWRDCL